ncbi:MAG: D-aminoacyl-tRNA deacylase [Nanoarchaeota archaeon]|nr:D-aminoacyl-tRNA deacylase [Nanoarchaeota archaeon]
MVFKKYLIVASKLDKAGVNITTQLSQFRQSPLWSSAQDKPSFDFYLVEEEIVRDSSFDKLKFEKYDFIIFASKHQSSSGEKSLCVHAPGNFGAEAKYGGVPGKVCPASGIFNKFIFEKLHKVAKEHNLDKKYKITMEATHHGPLINKPCVFIEVGSSENEWKDLSACFVIAETIKETIESFQDNPYGEVAIAIGGPHYCPSFNNIQLKSNVAISHVIAEYNFPITEEKIKEAIAKTTEDYEFVLLDWKGLGNAEERQKVVDILKKNYIRYKKTSEIGK